MGYLHTKGALLGKSKNLDLKAIAKFMRSDAMKTIIPLLKDPKSFDKEDAKILMSSKPMEKFFNSKTVKDLFPGNMNYSDVQEFLVSDDIDVIETLVKNPKELDKEDADKITQSPLLKKFLESEKFNSMMPNNLSFKKVQELMRSPSGKVIATIAKGEKFNEKDAQTLINSQPVQDFLSSEKFSEILPGDLEYEDVKSLFKEDVVNTVSALMKGKTLDVDDAKALIKSEPVQRLLLSDEFNKKLPGGLTFKSVTEMLESDAMKVLASIAKGDALSEEDARAIIKSDAFQNFLDSDEVKSMLPSGMSLNDVVDFVDSDASKALLTLAKGDEFGKEDARAVLESKPVQHFLESDKFSLMLPTDVTYKNLKSLMSKESITKILEIIKKSPKDFTVDDAKMILESEQVQTILEDRVSNIIPKGSSNCQQSGCLLNGLDMFFTTFWYLPTRF